MIKKINTLLYRTEGILILLGFVLLVVGVILTIVFYSFPEQFTSLNGEGLMVVKPATNKTITWFFGGGTILLISGIIILYLQEVVIRICKKFQNKKRRGY